MSSSNRSPVRDSRSVRPRRRRMSCTRSDGSAAMFTRRASVTSPSTRYRRARRRVMASQPVGVDDRLECVVHAVGRGPFDVPPLRALAIALDGGVRVEPVDGDCFLIHLCLLPSEPRGEKVLLHLRAVFLRHFVQRPASGLNQTGVQADGCGVIEFVAGVDFYGSVG